MQNVGACSRSSEKVVSTKFCSEAIDVLAGLGSFQHKQHQHHVQEQPKIRSKADAMFRKHSTHKNGALRKHNRRTGIRGGQVT